AGDAGPVGQIAHQQAVVADRRSDDGEHPFLDELAEPALDVVGRPHGQAAGLAGHQLDGPVEDDLGDPEVQGLLEAGPFAGLGAGSGSSWPARLRCSAAPPAWRSTAPVQWPYR